MLACVHGVKARSIAVAPCVLLVETVAGTFIAVIIKANELVWLHASAASRLAATVPRDASGRTAAIGLVNRGPDAFDLSPLILIPVTVDADGIVLHTREIVITAVIGVPWDIVRKALS